MLKPNSRRKNIMAMVVQHNLTAMNANRQLGITSGAQAKSSEKLSSGYRINRAGDDAAGLTISEKMRSQGGDRPPTPSVHRLRLGLPGYLILFAPPAFAPQRRSRPRGPPSPPVFHPISAHSTATPGVPPSPTGPKPRRFRGLRGVEPPASTPGLPGRLRALYAQ